MVLFGLGLALGLFASINNASIGTGILMGAGVFRRRKALLLSATGVLVGTVLEGGRMSGSASRLAPILDNYAAMASVLLGIIIVLYMLTARGVPVSITQMSVGALVAVSLISGTMPNIGYLLEIALGWVAAPLASLLISSLLYRRMVLMLGKAKLNLIRLQQILRVLVVVSSFYISYVVGANLVGFISSITAGLFAPSLTYMLIYGIASAIGVFMVMSEVSIVVGFKTTRLGTLAAVIAVASGSLIVHIATWLELPVSITQCVMGGVFGISLAMGSLRMGAPREIVRNWILSPALSMLLAGMIYMMLV